MWNRAEPLQVPAKGNGARAETPDALTAGAGLHGQIRNGVIYIF